jgi:hypothetical protein
VVELQESNRTTSEALQTERQRSKYLERVIQHKVFMNVPTEGQGVRFPSSAGEFSLITLEQQFSSASSNCALLSQQSMEQLFQAGSYLGMSPVPIIYNRDPSCVGVDPPSLRPLPGSYAQSLPTLDSLEYNNSSSSASSPPLFLESGFLVVLGLPSLARGWYERLRTRNPITPCG